MSEEVTNFCGNLVADATKDGQSFLFAALSLTWIGEAPMNLTACIGKEGAGFCGLIANSDHQVYRRRARECLNALGRLATDINANLLPRFDGERMHDAWLGTRTEDFVGCAASCSQHPT